MILVPVMTELPGDLSKYMYSADYKDILTINRSNGGLTYFSDGEVIRKWAAGKAGDLAGGAVAGGAGSAGGSLAQALAGNPAPVRVRAVSLGRVRFEGLCLGTIALLLLI